MIEQGNFPALANDNADTLYKGIRFISEAAAFCGTFRAVSLTCSAVCNMVSSSLYTIYRQKDDGRMIKNIVFDLGNVLVDFKPLEWLHREYGVVKGDFLYNHFCLSPLWVDLDLGSKTLEEVERILCRDFPEKASLIKDCTERYFGMLTPITEGCRILEQLVLQGYPAFYLTNYHAGAFLHLQKTYPWFSHFQGGVCSAHCGLIKPDPAIYQLLCHKMHIQPGNSLFLDDTAANTEAAALLGFHTILVHDPADLGRNLHLKLS